MNDNSNFWVWKAIRLLVARHSTPSLPHITTSKAAKKTKARAEKPSRQKAKGCIGWERKCKWKLWTVDI